MPSMSLFRRITSTRYIFLLSGLAFVVWSLASSIVPKSSTLSALLQMDLDQSTTELAVQHFTNSSSNSKNTTSNSPSAPNPPNLPGLGIAYTHIYVISLAGRRDRRDQMEALRTIQGLTWTVVDAVSRNSSLIGRVLNRVALQRAGDSSGGSTTKTSFRWPEEIDALSVSRALLKQSGSDTWSVSEETLLSASGGKHASKLSGKSGKWKSGSALASVQQSLSCAIEDDSIPTFANDTPPEWMVLTPAKIACWHSHVSAIRRFVDGKNWHGHRREEDVAVILEDDIDMAKDISTRLSQVWAFLPAGWDIVFLGHCWSDESHYLPLTEFPDMNLHPSHSPKCTHAYALSFSGARRLLQHLRHPPFAYSRALDQAYAWLVRSGRLRSYSVVPSLVVQRKTGSSDISSGSGSEWRESLSDGVLDK